ncbi:MAG: hypothetical protein JEY79_11845 [Pseudodesulfovibrio sp.]|nr:hypothetical protein [Pseudodesulfovibrio sp.]
MKTSEIGLSLYQPIRETCFSGYVEVREERKRLVIGVEVEESFKGDATMEIVLLSDCDDGMFAGSELYRTRPLTSEDLGRGSSYGFELKGLSEPYFCLWYVVNGGAFTQGKVFARISDEQSPWFVTTAELVEVSGVPWDEPKPERKLS